MKVGTAVAVPVFVMLFIVPIVGVAFAEPVSAPYEVWVLDQGLQRLVIFPGGALESGRVTRPPEVIDLAPFGFTIPHMVTFAANGAYAIVSDAGTGRVGILRASDRQVVWAEIVGDHIHHSEPTPDGRAILAADTGHRALVEILADFEAEDFAIGRTLDLQALEDGVELVNNAPICFTFSADGGKAYVTLRGGGLAIVDVEALEVIRTIGRSRIAAAGCGAVRTRDGGQILLNSGTATSGSLYVLDAATDELVASISLTAYGRDAHGLALLPRGGLAWNVNTVDDNGVVFDIDSHEIVATLPFVGDAPDLLAVSPSGTRVFATLRGPNPLTRAPHAAGNTPGLAVLQVRGAGLGATYLGVLPVAGPSEQAASDPHGLALRLLTP